jgi:opacity protein-like surface antigen
MRTTARKLGLLTGALALLVAAPALAQQETFGEPQEPQSIFAPQNVGIFAGGGLADFADGDMRDFTDLGGAWEVTALLGTRSLIGVELTYFGSAQDVDALGLDSDAVLIGTMFEATGRVNVLPQESFTPFVIGGIGYARYDITNSDFNTSNVANDDDMMSVPVGGGIGFRAGGALIEARGTYRFMFYDDLVASPTGAGNIDQDNWSATARVGFEF